MTKDKSELIPNTFQHPNFYVDWLHYYLRPEEIVVLDKAVREILGWWDKISDRKARIALSIFMDGKMNDEGKRLCLGCGLGVQAVRRALIALNQYGILTKEGQPNQLGQMFYLQTDMAQVDWDGLSRRRARWDRANAERTSKATEASLAARGLTSDVGGNVARYPNPLGIESESTTTPGLEISEGVTSDVREGVTSDVNKETQEEIYSSGDGKEDLDQLWKRARAQIQLRMTQATFNAHFVRTRLLPADNGAWRLRVDNENAAHWINRNHRRTVIESLRMVSGEEADRELEIVTE